MLFKPAAKVCRGDCWTLVCFDVRIIDGLAVGKNNNNNFKLKVKAKPQRKDYITQQKATAMFTTKKTVILGCFVISSILTPL